MTAPAFPIAGQNLIGGQWSPDGSHFDSLSPGHRELVVGKFPASTRDDAAAAVAAARAAYPAWRRTSRIRRAELFDNLAQIVKRETDNLAQLMARECGKVVTECRAEVVEGLHMIQYVFGTGRHADGRRAGLARSPEKDAFMRRKPWGVVAVITPWNFPFAVPLWMLGPSLLEGNTAVFKPSEDTPAIGQRLVELFVEAGFPPGVVNLVHGDGEVGEALVQESRRQRRAVHRQLRRRPAHPASLGRASYDRIVACEMGSKSAVIVCEDARLDLAVDCGLISAFKTSGQRCVSAGRMLVHEKLIDAFADKLVAQARRLRIGDPLDAGNFTGPVINQAAVEKVLRYNELARDEGAEILLDGGRSDAGRRRHRLLSVAVHLPHRASARACAASARRCSARTWP